MKERKTKQKDLIFNEIMSSKSHPTIKQLCKIVKEKDNSIGQATVYRQIDKLVKAGKVKKIANSTGDDCYDGDMSNHFHYICNNCNKVYDLECNKLNEINDYLKSSCNFNIDEVNITLRGVCNSCLKGDLNE